MQRKCSQLRWLIKQRWNILVSLIASTAFLISYFIYQLPEMNSPPLLKWPLPIYIYSREGEWIAELGKRKHEAVTIEDVPLSLREALLVTEDKRFFEHHGIDIRGLIRAALKLLKTGRKSQGGSTITMQTARNYYLTREKTFLRKLKEIFIALKMERHFTKEQILELYLNKIYMGHRTFGIGAAAKFYFEKSLKELTIAEMALLAGMPQAPALINPVTDPVAAKKRRDFVLYRLHRLGCINQAAYDNALKEAVNVAVTTVNQPALEVPYALDMIREALVKALGTEPLEGYHVYTTLEGRTQRLAEQAIFKSLMEYDQRHGYRGPEKSLGQSMRHGTVSVLTALKRISAINRLWPAVVITAERDALLVLLASGEHIRLDQPAWDWLHPGKKVAICDYLKRGDVIRIYREGQRWHLGQVPAVQSALVALDPLSGAVKALSGGFSYRFSQFNRVTQAARQMGSSFKPFIYAAAFEKGYNLSDVFNDAPLVFAMQDERSPWRPHNVSHSFYGVTRLRVALVTSVNLATIRLLEVLGISNVISLVQKCGFDVQKWPNNLSLALGSVEATPLAMTRGYAVFANGGYCIDPYIIDHITDYQGHLLYQATPKVVPKKGKSTVISQYTLAPKVLSDEAVFLTSSALKEVIPYSGVSIAKELGRKDLAGKTGTTNDTVDCLFIGYHDTLVAGVWMGYDNRKPLHEYAYTTALPLWLRFMKPVVCGLPEKAVEKPRGIVVLPISLETGWPVAKASSDTSYEYFQKSTLGRYLLEEGRAQSDTFGLSKKPLF